MMESEMMIEYAKSYASERLAEADHRRLVRQVVAGQQMGLRPTLSLKGRVGMRLVSLGERLGGTQTPIAPRLAGVDNSC